MSADDELAAMFLAVGGTNFTPGAKARRWPTAALPEIVELLVIPVGQRRHGAALAAIVQAAAHRGRARKARFDEVIVHAALRDIVASCGPRHRESLDHAGGWL